MKKMKKLACAAAISGALLFAQPVFADSLEGETIVTLGADLTAAQKEAILTEMGASPNDRIVTVSNAEEHKYLDAYIPPEKIGSKALSNARIQIGKEGSGIVIITHNISYVTEQMYANALSTAGVKDVQVFITAPFPVSGTGALTGVIKSYADVTGKEITEDRKNVANQEIATTADVTEQLAKESDKETAQKQTTDLISDIKENMAKEQPTTKEGVRDVVTTTIDSHNITLGDVQINNLVNLFFNMNNLSDFNWDTINKEIEQATSNISEAKDKLGNLTEGAKNITEDVQLFFASEKGEQAKDDAVGVFNGLVSFFKAIANFFSNLFS